MQKEKKSLVERIFKAQCKADEIALDIHELDLLFDVVREKHAALCGPTCPYCNSNLTVEQSTTRLKLDINANNINQYRLERKHELGLLVDQIKNDTKAFHKLKKCFKR